MSAAIMCQEIRKSFKTKVSGKGNRRKLFRMGARKKQLSAVDTLNLEVKRGEIFGIVGPNGSGKSTLVRLISTLLLPDSGHIEVFGLDVVRDRLRVRRMINRARQGGKKEGRQDPGQVRFPGGQDRSADGAPLPGHAADGGHYQGLFHAAGPAVAG